MLDTYESRKPIASWRRPPGRPRNVWLNKVQEDASPIAICAVEISDRHGSRSGATVHSDYATMMMMMMMMIIHYLLSATASRYYRESW